MKLTQEENNITYSGKFEKSQYKIATSAKAYDILSSKLYSDIHKAVIRELSTNAWDAHISAGNTKKQFDVHLPNSLEPEFWIRDYGTGLSHDDMLHLYTTYFESNKVDTNNQNGCWGLGSKSPFAYTDTFSVTSFFNGRKTIYTMTKTIDGPMINSTPFMLTDEPNGLEVKFACKKDDIPKFTSKASQVYKYFDLLPKFIGRIKPLIEKHASSMSGNGWKLYRNKWRQSEAIMGWIGYQIDVSKFDTDRYKALELPIEIEFPIGDLEIAVSREDLHYSNKTIESIQDRAIQIEKEIIDLLNLKLENKCKSYYEAKSTILYLVEYGGPLYRLKDSIFKYARWHNRKFADFSDYSLNGTTEFTTYTMKQTISGTQISKSNTNVYIRYRPKTKFFLNDIESNPTRNIKAWMKDPINECEVSYLFEPIGMTEETWDSHHEKIGLNRGDIKLVSDLPKPKTIRTKRSYKTNKTPVFAKGYKIEKLPYNKVIHTEVDIDYQTPQVYVPVRRYNRELYSTVNECEISSGTLARILRLMEELEIDIDCIYGIKSGYVDKLLSKEDKWVDLTDYIKTQLDNYIQKNNLEDQISDFLTIRNIDNVNRYLFITEHIKIDTIFSRFAKEIQTKSKIPEEVISLHDLGTYVGYKHNNTSSFISEDEIKQRYPLLEWVHHSRWETKEGSSEKNKALAKYIMLVEKKEV